MDVWIYFPRTFLKKLILNKLNVMKYVRDIARTINRSINTDFYDSSSYTTIRKTKKS